MGRIVMKIIEKKMRVLSNLCVTVEKLGLGGSILALVPREMKDSSSLSPQGPGSWIFLPYLAIAVSSFWAPAGLGIALHHCFLSDKIIQMIRVTKPCTSGFKHIP